MAISNTLVLNTETTLYQAGASASVAILSLFLCNTDTVSHTVTVYVYPNGGSASNTTTILKSITIPASDTFQWSANDKLVLGPSDKVSAVADTTNKVAATINYFVM